MNQQVQAILGLKTSFDDSSQVKDAIDRWILAYLYWSKTLRNDGWNIRGKNEKKIIDGKVFARMILPFSDTIYDSRNAMVCFVPSQNVLAGSYRYEYHDLDILEIEKIITDLDKAADFPYQEQAQYIQILQGLPIYIVQEGKNRVYLYRKAGKDIRASVVQNPYPHPDELELIKLPFGYTGLKYKGHDPDVRDRLKPWQRIKTFNGVEMAILPFKESVSLLSQYGVKWGGYQNLLMHVPFIARKTKLYVAHHFYIAIISYYMVSISIFG